MIWYTSCAVNGVKLELCIIIVFTYWGDFLYITTHPEKDVEEAFIGNGKGNSICLGYES